MTEVSALFLLLGITYPDCHSMKRLHLFSQCLQEEKLLGDAVEAGCKHYLVDQSVLLYESLTLKQLRVNDYLIH